MQQGPPEVHCKPPHMYCMWCRPVRSSVPPECPFAVPVWPHTAVKVVTVPLCQALHWFTQLPELKTKRLQRYIQTVKLHEQGSEVNHCRQVFTNFSTSVTKGVCSTDLRLDTSTNGLKQVYTSPETIYQETYFLKIVHLKLIYNFQKKVFVSNKYNT